MLSSQLRLQIFVHRSSVLFKNVNAFLLRQGLLKRIPRFHRQLYSRLSTSALVTKADSVPATSKKETPTPLCAFCGENHWSTDCQKFATYESRRDKIKGNCFICLRSGHSYKKCSKKDKPCFHCRKKGHHHTSLCPKKFNIDQPSSTSSVTPAPSTGTATKPTTATSTAVLINECTRSSLLTVTTTIRNPHNNFSYRAPLILDTASDRTHATHRSSDKLQLPIERIEKLDINTFGAQSSQSAEIPAVRFTLDTTTGTRKEILALLTESIIPDLNAPNIAQFRRQFPNYADTQLADDGEEYDVDILLSLDYLVDILKWSKIDIDANTVLLDTIFGWVIAHRQIEEKSTVINCFFIKTQNDPIQKLWALDSIGITEKPNDDESTAIEQFYQSIKFRDGRFM